MNEEMIEVSEAQLTPVQQQPAYKILEGILDPLECADELEHLYLHGSDPGLTTGLQALDPIYRVCQGQWTVVTGVPGSGKSTMVDTLMVGMAEAHGWKHLICSPEHQPVARHIAALAGIHARCTFNQSYMTEGQYQESLAFVQDHFRFINPPEENFTPSYILDLAKAVEELGFEFNGITVDPWNEMEHRRPDFFSETEYVSYALSKFRRYVRDKQKHLWLVAHPTKLRKLEKKNLTVEESAQMQYPVVSLYDISGSAHFFNKADNGLSVWRDKYSHENHTTIYVQKVRFKECGALGEAVVKYNWQSGRLEDI